MSRAFICDHAERLFVSYKGLVELLDMDNIHCRRDNQLTIVSIEECDFCEEAVWSGHTNRHDDWDYNLTEGMYCEVGTECEYNDCGE
jgi:hypothetical protein